MSSPPEVIPTWFKVRAVYYKDRGVSKDLTGDLTGVEKNELFCFWILSSPQDGLRIIGGDYAVAIVGIVFDLTT